ncbi:hypothetical protein DXG01_016232 [Tephrocybe rancida]|nr:hypothetical protein DXG01_016232 [Tephrocybe rancida]
MQYGFLLPREPAQAQIFKKVDISLSAEDCQRNCELLDILQNNPRIGSFVLSLGLSLEEIKHITEFMENILSKLTCVRSLNLVGGGIERPTWSQFPAPAKASLLRLMWLPTLRHIELNYVDFPFPYLRFCMHLKSMELLSRLYNNRLKIEETPEPEVAALVSPPTTGGASWRLGHLKHLSLGNFIAYRKFMDAALHPTSTLSLTRIQ